MKTRNAFHKAQITAQDERLMEIIEKLDVLLFIEDPSDEDLDEQLLLEWELDALRHNLTVYVPQ